MVNNYFQLQTQVLDTDNNFRCPDDCGAPGCWKADIIVEITFFDLVRLGKLLNTPVSDLFFQFCHLGLMIYEENARYKKLLIKAKKPCLFFSDNKCLVHDAKPLNCILFPGIYHIKGWLPKLSKNPLFYSFPCMKKPMDISEKRKNALKQLRKMSLREQALSYAYLFNIPCFVIDEKSLRKKLRKNKNKRQNLTLFDYDKFLNNLLESYGVIERVQDKISGLDDESEIKNLFAKLNDRVMMEDLMEKMVRPVVIHKLKTDGIKQLNKRPTPPAVYFM